MEPKDLPDRQGRKGLPGLPDHKDLLGRTDLPVRQDHRDLQGPWGQVGPWDLRGRKAVPDQLGPLVRWA